MDYRSIKDFPRYVSGRMSAYTARQNVEEQETDFWALAVFVAAISGLLIACFYVVSRLSKERAYREKWNDYDDCGWA
jgi:NADH:ubiquinone oxidoreductase subunit 3 (subunit A)